MTKVIKCEFRKCIKGLAFYICMLIMIIIPLSEFVFMQISSNFGEKTEAAQAMVDAFLNANGDQIFRYLYYVLFNGGSIFVVLTVMAAIIISEDYTRGTMKYVLLLSSRDKLGLGKVGILLIVSTIIHLVGLVVPLIISIISRKTYFGVYSLEQIILYVLIGWSTITAFTILVGIIGCLTKNVPATIGIGLGVYLICAGVGVHLSEKVKKYIFIMNINKIGESSIETIHFALGVSCITLILFMIILFYQIKNKAY